ncbi:type I polyketide synthase [Streptomyces sp. B5E4]|uniref:type I polyketide synthase n=1 Tax=Streptomyces sp. B5E4 TaxID=3153568 RepID=UPI00325E93B9
MTSLVPTVGTPDYREELARALGTISVLRNALEERQRAAREPVAIVGAGCRFPGRVSDPESMWRLLTDGVDAISPFPAERGDAAPYYDPNPEAAAKAYVLDAGYLPDVTGFDAQLFGISPPEAAGMDPQQRLALEVAWEALERAGIPPGSLGGSRTGVYMGASTNDYVRLRQEFGTPESIDPYQLLGESSFIAGRIAHTFDLRGPVQVIDTACSSSLVAVHQAASALRSGDIDLALAGGVNVILSPYGFVLVSKARAVSPDGRCKTFDASADGYARGEGCGVVVLKRLSDAERDGDDILAVIRGTAVNHDGRASGISVPSGPAQQDVIRDALRDAGVAPGRIGYVEAHGTGTPLGDPIELRALDTVLADSGSPAGADPVYIGSVKTNIGHLEAAAGIAGLIKVLLAVRHGRVPPSLHFTRPNPNVDWRAMRLRVATELTDWPSRQGPRVAGLSSFGASGTNAHLVIEQAPAREGGEVHEVHQRHQDEPAQEPAPATDARPAHLLPLSAHSEVALRDLADRWAAFIKGRPEVPPETLTRAATLHRDHHRVRTALVAGDTAGLARGLGELAQGVGGQRARRALPGHRAKVAFLFTGQGAQYTGMGLELHRGEPVFRKALESCAELLGTRPEELLSSPHSAEDTAWAQPALFAVEYALAQLWLSWGIKPAAVMGHSVGEYVAACVSGVLSLEDAVRLIALRGRLMASVTTPGAMVAVPLSEEAAAQVIHAAEGRADRVSIAAVNGPESTVLSGAADAVDEIVTELTERGVAPRRLKVSHAFHSPLLDAVLGELNQATATTPHAAPAIPLVSNLTGELATSETLAAPGYWSRHAREAVRFAPGMRALYDSGVTAFVEAGPGRTLLGLGATALGDPDLMWVPSIRQGRPEVAGMLTGLGRLYEHGAAVDWPALHGTGPASCADLPTYPFQHEAYDVVVDRSGGPRPGRAAAPAGDSVRFEIRWEATRPATAPASGDPAPGRTLLLADGSGLAGRLAERLTRLGGECHLAVPADTPDAAQAGATGTVHRVPPGDGKALRALLRSLGPLDRVIHLWALDVPPAGQATARDLENAQRLGAESVLHLVQEITDGSAGTSRLWLVTRGARSTAAADRPEGLAAAPLDGLGKVIALEHSELWGGSVDLDPAGGDAEHEADRLTAEILSPGHDDAVALRSGARLVPRLVPAAASPTPTPPVVREDASYLITGGLGGLGLTIADWLTGLGARHLVLTGRAGLPDRATWEDPGLPTAVRDRVECVRALERRGVTVTAVAADVCDAAAMTDVLRGIEETGRTLRGVIHAAGTAGAALLRELTPAGLHDVMRSKVTGAWTLHRLLGDAPLDFFVGMSSIASVWGSADLGAYAAANQFLDALAAYRRSQGLAGLSVNWGPWHVASGLGGDELLRRLEANGLRTLAPDVALGHLADLLAQGTTQAVVCDAVWPTLKPLLESRRPRPLLDRISDDLADAGDGGRYLAGLLAAEPDERERSLGHYLRERLAEQLGVPAEEFTQDASLVELGLDSLGVVQLLNRFRGDLGVRLDARVFFEEPAPRWPRLLATEIARQHKSDTATDAPGETRHDAA